jgi:hypothetical protein
VKRLHRTDLYSWSVFDEQRNIDFHSVLWARPGGNLVVDPLPMSEHDREHMLTLGGVATIVVTNSDHARDADALRGRAGAKVVGPAGERDSFPMECDRWAQEGEQILPGLVAYAMQGSKTAGELALVLEDTTLITGDLVRCHEGGKLTTLPPGKLSNQQKAMESVEALAAMDDIDTVLVGDGWPVFGGGAKALTQLAARLRASFSESSK